jgi:hypothetical protein
MTREDMLMILVDSFAYGVVKAEQELMGRSSVYSRAVGAHLAKYWIESLKKHGIELKPNGSPFQAVQNYMEVLGSAGLVKPENFTVEDKGEEVSVVARLCPYAGACRALLAEGVTEFACLRGAFLAYAIHVGARRNARYQIQCNPDQGCQITLKVV